MKQTLPHQAIGKPAGALAQFEAQGYAVFRNVLDAELVSEASRHVDWLCAQHPDLRPEQLGHRLLGEDPFWLRLVSDSRLLDIAEQFIGPDIALFASHYISKPPYDGQPVLWHQDGSYWPLDPMEVVSLWLAVDESTPENGCMRVVPGTQHLDLQALERRDDVANVLNSGMDAALVDESAAVDVRLDPGDVSVHHPNIIHGSNANLSPKRRCGLTFAIFQPAPAFSATNHGRPRSCCAASRSRASNPTAPARATSRNGTCRSRDASRMGSRTTASAMEFDPGLPGFTGHGITLSGIEPLVDGMVPPYRPPLIEEGQIVWQLDRGRVRLLIGGGGSALHLRLAFDGIDRDRAIDSIGLRFTDMRGVRRYLRNGYHSWDGSFFAVPGTPAGDGPPGKAPTLGFAMTAFLPQEGNGAALVGFTRHDRFQSRLRFGGSADRPTFDIETLWDRVPHDGAIEAEPMILLTGDAVEETLRAWSRIVATEAPSPPRLPPRRITGWCSWYNLYAAIDEGVIIEHLRGATAFRDAHHVPLDIFQIDDGFTPEMGDWLDVKPQFPRGMKPLLADIRAAGFTPGLWIAPFMVGNRSRLFAEHPDWVVRHATNGEPLAQMHFYGEFRWHKRSEEYYILDITHPGAKAYIREVFRTWRHDWGVGYFKTDFMLFGSEHGPDTARWYVAGLSRIAIWRMMAQLIREEIGDALLLGCGCPLWASVGMVDAVRVGRDIGVSWAGEYSAESLLRDQLTRNHASGILWQGDPDCILLRERFHHLSDDEVRMLALFGGLAGGVLMTSDKLDALPPVRAALFAALLKADVASCRFPQLGDDTALVLQEALQRDGATLTHVMNLSHAPVDAGADRSLLAPHASHVSGRLDA